MLNPNVEVLSVREFDQSIRERLGGTDDDFVISDRTTRIGSQRIGRDGALFLRRFQSPKGIAEAVFEHSAELHIEPQALLAEVYPLVRTLRLNSILIPPGASAPSKATRLSKGDQLGSFVVVDAAVQAGDTEILKGRGADGAIVAIKRVLSGAGEDVRTNLRREAVALEYAQASGCLAPARLISQDLERDEPYLCMEWLRGRTLFDLLRLESPDLQYRAAIVRSLVASYVELHGHGILHGDVHPNNVMVAKDGSTRLIDFGGAHVVAQGAQGSRIGLVQFYEPEVALAVLAGNEAPLPTARGEQYGVAVVAFATLTGSLPIALSLVTESALGQIATAPPRSFETFGLSWRRVEAVLGRALQKDPADRFPTLAAFGAALAEALETASVVAVSSPTKRSRAPGFAQDELKRAATQVSAEYGLQSPRLKGFDRGPKASLYGGAAGVALALLRIASLQDDGASLAAADLWVRRAKDAVADPLAFSDGSLGTSVETGKRSLFQSATGIHAIEALVRHANGDTDESEAAIATFASAISRSNSEMAAFPMDATNGAASLLFGLAWLLPIAPPARAKHLRSLGRQLVGVVEAQLLDLESENTYVGFAHGRAGAAFAILRWADAAGDAPPSTIRVSLGRLAALGLKRRTSLAWPVALDDDPRKAWTGWCHGSAGHLMLWALAARVLGDEALVETAQAAGHDIWRRRGSSGPSLCCGGAGEALALYELARATRADTWIDRGRMLTADAIRSAATLGSSQGLFRSALGVGLAAAESAEPAASVWPVLQSPLGTS